ncbi:hypothetical protein NHX12_000007 [Muraenolepis orangiensis]|uniref:Uncharacterized protein n=1 Tax=Muraenolepis orangiensis TaxID=630683 RepID=A0A9Q0D9Q5_9TELE|nr:hypothetical protein NHX12_000007 [Muraenolepis orangiensis]
MPAGVSPEEGGGEKLSRRHAVKLSPAAQVSVEECSLAVGEKVGYKSVKFAARMNRAVVVFLDSIDKVNSVVESGVAIRDVFTQVMPLFNSARRVPGGCRGGCRGAPGGCRGAPGGCRGAPGGCRGPPGAPGGGLGARRGAPGG